MYYDEPGAPWFFPRWKELTGVRHGLFPEDDKCLPQGWTRDTADKISSYFDQYAKQPTDKAKIKFASAKSEVPGRKAWRNWVNTLWKKQNIYLKIVDALYRGNLHPYTLAFQSGSPDAWPDANQFVPLAIDAVGLDLFGEECFVGDIVRIKIRDATKALISCTWSTLYTNRTRLQNRISTLEIAAANAFQGLCRIIPIVWLIAWQTWTETD